MGWTFAGGAAAAVVAAFGWLGVVGVRLLRLEGRERRWVVEGEVLGGQSGAAWVLVEEALHVAVVVVGGSLWAQEGLGQRLVELLGTVGCFEWLWAGEGGCWSALGRPSLQFEG